MGVSGEVFGEKGSHGRKREWEDRSELSVLPFATQVAHKAKTL